MQYTSIETKFVDGKKVVSKTLVDLPSFDLECVCKTQSMEFAQEKIPEWNLNEVHIEVWENDADRYDAGLWSVFKERVKKAFLILFKGRYRTDYLSISQQQAEELKNYLSSLEW